MDAYWQKFAPILNKCTSKKFLFNVHEVTIGDDDTGFKLSERFISYSQDILKQKMYLDNSISIEFKPYGKSAPIISEKDLKCITDEKLKKNLRLLNNRIQIIAY